MFYITLLPPGTDLELVERGNHPIVKQLQANQLGCYTTKLLAFKTGPLTIIGKRRLLARFARMHVNNSIYIATYVLKIYNIKGVLATGLSIFWAIY